MIATGSTAAAVPHTRPVPVPTAPRSRPEDDVVARVERARAWRSPIVLREGPDPDAVARLIRQGRLVEVAATTDEVAQARAEGAKPRRVVVKTKTGRTKVRTSYPRGSGPGLDAPTWDVEGALRQAREGATRDELATQYGVHPETISHQLRRRGFRFSKANPRALTPAQIEAIRESVKSGVSRAETANRLGHRYETVRRATVDLPLKRHPNAKMTPELVQAVLDAFADTRLTIDQIAAEHGIAARTVRRIAAGAGQTRAHRPGNAVGGATAVAALNELLRANGATNGHVRDWATANGIEVSPYGPAPRHLVEAYLASRTTATREDSPA